MSDMCWCAETGPVGDATPANPSRFANAAARDAAFKRAKEAGMPRQNGVPITGLQTQVMAMRMEGGGVTQGTAPGVEAVTSTGQSTHSGALLDDCYILSYNRKIPV